MGVPLNIFFDKPKQLPGLGIKGFTDGVNAERLSMYERFVLSGLKQFLLTPGSRSDLSTE